MASQTRPPTKPSPTPSIIDIDGNHIRNEILLGLPREEREHVVLEIGICAPEDSPRAA